MQEACSGHHALRSLDARRHSCVRDSRALLLCIRAAVPRAPRSSSTATSTSPNGSRRSSCDDWLRTVPFARDAAALWQRAAHSLDRAGTGRRVHHRPAAVERRIKPRTPRDAERLTGDTVALMVDFDATAQVGYEFAVGLGGGMRDGLITNQNKFDRDWDGAWQHAVRETDEQWFVEMFIPWSSISMRDSARRDAHHRRLRARAICYERDERYACPGITSEAAVFLSDFRRIEISQHDVGRAVSTSCPTAPRSPISSTIDTRFKAGADINWKASPNLWLAATLNPDFGQVESDELVVDFSAIETVFTDKRPFFTENQGIFDLRTPANGQLIYTRRIGAAPDDGSAGSSDIDAALKLTGTAGSLVYGAFRRAGRRIRRSDVGRLFRRRRALALPFEHARLGYLGTWTDRPFFDRDALVNAVDYEIDAERLMARRRPAHPLRHRHQRHVQPVRARHGRRSETTRTATNRGCRPTSTAAAPLTHTLKLLYIDDQFDMNDLGYMERNSLRAGRVGNQSPRRQRGRARQRRDAAPVHVLSRERRRASACSRACSCRATCSTRARGARIRNCATSRAAWTT